VFLIQYAMLARHLELWPNRFVTVDVRRGTRLHVFVFVQIDWYKFEIISSNWEAFIRTK